MQKAIKRFSYFIAGCFVMYGVYLVYFVFWKAPLLEQKGANPRPWILESRIQRGGIFARGGEKIAESLPSGGQFVRKYYYGSAYAHIVGYESKRLGKTGVESSYDGQLLGLEGSIKKRLEVRWGVKGVKGNDIVLTVDHLLQLEACRLLSPYRGAAVVLNPKTGEILALASSPSFDPNPPCLERNWEKLKGEPDHPLLNRATMGLYPPGSVLKIVTASLGLRRFPGLEGEVYECRGEIKIDGRVLKDLRPHGEVDLKRALALSCNSYFVELGLRLGADDFARGLAAFGWGGDFHFDIPAQRIPLPRESFYTPDGLAEAAIGQGEIVVTPLFMAMVAGAIGNDGVMMKPYLVSEIRGQDGSVLWRARPTVLRIAVSPEIAAKVREAMVEVVKNGTGTAAAIPGMDVAGKTGSAENPAGEPHAWFVALAPAQDPQVAVSVIIEHGGQGGRVAAPIARELIKIALRRGGF
ncbi:MAG: peptidoglycan D,D-transpeptidase FtsI family protein [Thermacetogeniaceae bacterium]